MKRKENIEELIRQKLGEKSFPYDESYWAEAREVMAADQRRRRRFIFWLLLGAAALAAGLLLFLPSKETVVHHAAQQQKLEKYIKLWNASDDDSTQTNKLFITRNASEAPLVGASTEAYPEGNTPGHPSPSIAFNDKHGADFQHSAVSDSRLDGNSDLALTDGKQIPVRETQTDTDLSRSKGSSDTGFFTPLDHSPAPSSFSPFPALARLSQRISRTGSNPPLRGIRPSPRPRQMPEWLFQVGGGSALGINGQQHRYLEAGIAGRFPLNRRLHILGGASYWLRFSKDQLTTREVIAYDYTFRTTEYRLHVHQMHYLEGWLGLGYQLSPRLSFHGGLGAALLLSNLATYEVKEHFRLQTHQLQHHKSLGYREGFAPWDLRLRTGLSYRLNALTELAVEMRVGLRDITNDTYFDPNHRDENTFAGIMLRYKINR